MLSAWRPLAAGKIVIFLIDWRPLDTFYLIRFCIRESDIGKMMYFCVPERAYLDTNVTMVEYDEYAY
jgi:hypothetical protein